jgi:hypothetical protein
MTEIRNVNLGLGHLGSNSTLKRFSRWITPLQLTRNYVLTLRNLAIVSCFGFLALSAQAQTAAVDKNWTTVGSVGTLDEKSVGKVFFDQSKVQMGQVGGTTTTGNSALISTQTDSAVIRYNVTAVDSLFAPRLCRANKFFSSLDVRLRLRYLAAQGGRVVAKLIEVNPATGTETLLITFDSAAPNLPRSDNYHVQSISVCGRPWNFDFETKAYYIEATLTGSSIFSTPAGIQMIQIDNFTRPAEVDLKECTELAKKIASGEEDAASETDIIKKKQILAAVGQLRTRSQRLGCPAS